MTDRVVYCNGGDEHLGHPKVYINLVCIRSTSGAIELPFEWHCLPFFICQDKPGAHACNYCGLRFIKKEEHHWIFALITFVCAAMCAHHIIEKLNICHNSNKLQTYSSAFCRIKIELNAIDSVPIRVCIRSTSTQWTKLCNLQSISFANFHSYLSTTTTLNASTSMSSRNWNVTSAILEISFCVWS